MIIKKYNNLNTQGLENLKLSRRNFFLYSTTLASLGILNRDPIKPSTNVLNAINTMGVNASTVRVGKWMRDNLAAEKSLQIVKAVEERLASTSVLSKSTLRKMISSDYLLERTVDISNIRFSIVEVVLCIAISTYES